MYKTKEEYKEQLDKTKTFGRDIDFDEYIHMKSIGVINYYLDLTRDSVFSDKFYISIQDEHGNSKPILQTYDYRIFISKLSEVKNEANNLKTRSKYNVVSGKFPGTYVAIREFQKLEDSGEQKKKFAEEINTPPLEAYQNDLNNLNF